MIAQRDHPYRSGFHTGDHIVVLLGCIDSHLSEESWDEYGSTVLISHTGRSRLVDVSTKVEATLYVQQRIPGKLLEQKNVQALVKFYLIRYNHYTNIL